MAFPASSRGNPLSPQRTSSPTDNYGSITKKHPTLDSVILNAGIQRRVEFADPESIDLSVINLELTTNYLSYVHFTVALLPHLKSQSQSGPTSLIYTSSALALIPVPRCANYCASKAALHQLLLALRVQLKASPSYSNIKVIEILPPAVQTELHDQKHQPDIQDGRKIGMPLEEFTEQAWMGLLEGKEQIPVGLAEVAYERFEEKRQEMFGVMLERFGMKR